MSIAPPHGELLEIPTFSASGHVTVLLFENVPGGDTEVLADAKYDEDPAAFERLVLEKVRVHHPQVFERIDTARFGLTGPEDLLQGAVTPVLREDYAVLPNERVAIALGDAHSVVDPVVGQGANSASYSTWELGTVIGEDPNFDERFCPEGRRPPRQPGASGTSWQPPSARARSSRVTECSRRRADDISRVPARHAHADLPAADPAR